MLLVKIGLVLAVFTNGRFAMAKHGNRHPEKNDVRDLAGHLRASVSSSAGRNEGPASSKMRFARNLARVRQADIAYPPLYGPGDKFYEAESLEYFKQMEKTGWFEWVNPDEIQAGATTCGFLFPDLGLLPNVSYPFIKVYVCMRFANVQPAAKGNMFVHCGGPGSLSDCTGTMSEGGFLSQKVFDEYNILSIDQASDSY